MQIVDKTYFLEKIRKIFLNVICWLFYFIFYLIIYLFSTLSVNAYLYWEFFFSSRLNELFEFG